MRANRYLGFLGLVLVIGAVFSAMPSKAQTSNSTQTLPKPKGRVILTVTGAITNTNAPGVAQFDIEMLDAITASTIKTSMPWYKQPTTFAGPSLSDLLSTVGAPGSTLSVTALNDFKVVIPVEDARKYQPIVAMRLEGKPMSVRDKGPLFMVYPFDARPELKNDTFYSRSIWQIANITVK